MLGVLATSLFEASRAVIFSEVPRNEDWRLAEARRREGTAPERALEAGLSSPEPQPGRSCYRPRDPSRR